MQMSSRCRSTTTHRGPFDFLAPPRWQRRVQGLAPPAASGLLFARPVARSALVALMVGTASRQRKTLVVGIGAPQAQNPKETLGDQREENSDDDDDADDDDDEHLGFSVAPWADSVSAKPIVIISDCTGEAARLLVSSAWAQFDSQDEADLSIAAHVRNVEDLDLALASRVRPDALIIYTLASPKLNKHLVRECRKHRFKCFDALEPILSKIERLLGKTRMGSERNRTQRIAGVEESFSLMGSRIFAVSCGAGNCTYHLACAALRQFDHSIGTVTVCPGVRSLEEVLAVVEAARNSNALVIFTFASPGMSRFMRLRCEKAGVPYADAFQPLLVSMELFLSHPFFGVPGGLDVSALAEAQLKWEIRRVH